MNLCSICETEYYEICDVCDSIENIEFDAPIDPTNITTYEQYVELKIRNKNTPGE